MGISNLLKEKAKKRGILRFSSALELKTRRQLSFGKQAGLLPSNLGDTPQNHEQGASLNAAKGWNSALCRLCWIWEWNYSTVLLNKVKKIYCSDWCLCAVITL